MRLPYTIDTFTPAAWEQTFGAFIMANRSHWRGAPYDAVIQLLRTKGRFEFAVKAMGTWTNTFALHILPDGHLDAEMILNTDLSSLMRRHLEKMREEFYNELRLSTARR